MKPDPELRRLFVAHPFWGRAALVLTAAVIALGIRVLVGEFSATGLLIIILYLDFLRDVEEDT